MNDTWYERSLEVIRAVEKTFTAATTEDERYAALFDAYPFGERKYFPYKAWCKALDDHKQDLARLVAWQEGR